MSVTQSLVAISRKEAVRTILAESKANTPYNYLVRRVKDRFNITMTTNELSKYKSEIRKDALQMKEQEDINRQQVQTEQSMINNANELANHIVQTVETSTEEEMPVKTIVALANKINKDFNGGWQAFEKCMTEMEQYEPLFQIVGNYHKLKEATTYIRELKK